MSRELIVQSVLIWWEELLTYSGNDKRPESRGFKKLSEFSNCCLQGHESSQDTCFTLFWCNQRGADEPWPISADFLNPRLSGLVSFPNIQVWRQFDLLSAVLQGPDPFCKAPRGAFSTLRLAAPWRDPVKHHLIVTMGPKMIAHKFFLFGTSSANCTLSDPNRSNFESQIASDCNRNSKKSLRLWKHL